MDKEKNIWLFGAGVLAKKFINDDSYKDRIKQVRGIIDNDYQKVGQKIENKIIYFYNDALHKINKNVDKIIITCGKGIHVEAIVNQLVRDGLQDLLEGVYHGNDIITYGALYSTKINSQFGEELGLQNLFNKIDINYKGFYVDVGAYHPFILSNTRWAYDRGWHGINIDPNKDNIALFNAFRPRDVNLCCGVSDEDGIMPFYSYTSGCCNSFDDTLARNLTLINVENVPVKKLNNILHEYEVKHIDILDIDAEGFDEKIIKSFDWDRYRPICILVEVISKQKSHFWTSDIHKILTSYRYEFVSLFVKTLMYVQEDWIK